MTRGRREARVFQLQSNEKLIFPFTAIGKSVLAFNPDNDSIALTGDKGNTVIHELRTGERVWETPSSEPRVDRAYANINFGTTAYGVGGLLFSSSMSSGQSLIWDTRTQSKLFDFGTNAPPIVGKAQFTPDGRNLIILGGSNKNLGDMKIQVWKIERGVPAQSNSVSASLVRTLDSGNYNGFVVAPDNQRFAFNLQQSNSPPKILLGEIDGQTPPRSIATYSYASGSGENFTFSPDSRQLLMVNTNWEVITLDTETGGEVMPPLSVIHTTSASARVQLRISLSPDGTKLAVIASSVDSGVEIWDWKNRRRIYSLPKQGGGITWQLTWSPDSQKLCVCNDESGIALWNLQAVEQALNKLGLNL